MAGTTKGVPTPEMMAVVDPLGEIRRTAERLWAEAGKPPGTSWEHYWRGAEAMLTAGRGQDSQARSTKLPLTPGERPTRLISLADDSSADPLVRAVASVLQTYLDEHESVALCRILVGHEFVLAGAQGEITVAPKSAAEAARFVAELAGEYDERFLAKEGGDIWQVPLDRRAAYWLRQLEELEQKDEPLTYNDQNTIRRILAKIKESSAIKAINYRVPPFETV